MTAGHAGSMILIYGRSVSSSLSVLASGCIVYKIFLRFQHAPNTSPTKLSTYYRMLLGISVLDMICSFWQALSTLVLPASTGVYGAHGTITTCTAQGFFVQMTCANTIYMAMLSMYFMLLIRYNVSERAMQRKYEVWLHAIPWVVALGTACTGMALKLFNPVWGSPEMGCWIAPHPRGYKSMEYYSIYAWLFSYTWFFASAFVIVVCNLAIYAALRAQEKKNASYGESRYTGNNYFSTSTANTTSSSFSSFLFSEKKKENRSIAPATERVKEQGEYDCSTDIECQRDKESENEMTDSSTSDELSLDGFDTSESSSFPRRTSKLSTNPMVALIRQSKQYRASKERKRKAKASQVAAMQSLLYVASAIFTTVWIFMPWVSFHRLEPNDVRSFYFDFMINIFYPIQGVFNLFVFVRLQYIRLRKTEKEWSRLRCLKSCLFSPASAS